MVRPAKFWPNDETSGDNAFQRTPGATRPEVAKAAAEEVSRAVDRLRAAGVTVHLFEDDGTRDTPDSVFPNNWFSTHASGQLVLYPMFAPSRRGERREDIIEALKARFYVGEVLDYTGAESEDRFLEGTGAMVLDHVGGVAYMARSKRADEDVLKRFCSDLGFESVVFDALDGGGVPIYHTNVLMCIGTEFALVGISSIVTAEGQRRVRASLEAGGRRVIELEPSQVAAFAGNAIELLGTDGPRLCLSQTALDALSAEQRAAIESFAPLLPIAVPTIEYSGGSARCMIAGIHLKPRP